MRRLTFVSTLLLVLFCSQPRAYAQLPTLMVERVLVDGVLSEIVSITIASTVAVAPLLTNPVTGTVIAVGISTAIIGNHLYKAYQAYELAQSLAQMNRYNLEATNDWRRYNNQVMNHAHGFKSQEEANLGKQQLQNQKQSLNGVSTRLTDDVNKKAANVHNAIKSQEERINSDKPMVEEKISKQIEQANDSLNESVDLLNKDADLITASIEKIYPNEACESDFNSESSSPPVILDDFQKSSWFPFLETEQSSSTLFQLRDAVLTADTDLLHQYHSGMISEETFKEQETDLQFAKLSTFHAGKFFEQGDIGKSEEVIAGVHAVLDDMHSYQDIRDKITAGSHFLAGIIQGMTGLPGQPVNREFKTYWYAGNVVGNAAGIALDMAAMADGILKMTLGGSLGVVSYGTLAPIGTALAAQGALEVSAGAAGFIGHSEAFQKNFMEARANKRTDGRKPNEPYFKTNKEVGQAAEKLGFKKTNYRSEGQPIFTDGKRFITKDIDGHNGGAWKMAKKLEDLLRRETRTGTYDANLKRIGD